jgi:hypothetical protein
VVLVPIEHLGPAGASPAFGALATVRRGWSPERRALFDAGWALYWTRGDALARRTRTWVPPRRRHVAVVDDPLSVRPYAQLLNTSAWTIYGADLEPATSDPELLAYLLVLGDRMAVTGEVTTAAVQTALWWLERTEVECAAFAEAARRSTRPDAAALQAVADALPWLRRLHHDPLRPPMVVARYRPIPGTGLLVPPTLDAEPPALVERWRTVADGVVAAFRKRHRAADPSAAASLEDWLAGTAPELLVMAGGRIVWDPARPRHVAELRRALEGAGAAAVTAVRDDLGVVARVTRDFRAAVVDPKALPAAVPANTMQSGYAFLHGERTLIAYDLDEPGIERLAGPPLPYARAMLAARTAHEWAHLADAGGWVPRVVDDEAWRASQSALAEVLEAVVRDAPARIRAETAADVADLAAERPLGRALLGVIRSRLPDYRANLVARHLLGATERETYVRHNVRALRHEYAPVHRWRLLVRYLFEYQYLRPALGMSAVPDPADFFVGSTWFDRDFFVTAVLDPERFAALADGVGRLCEGYAIDATKLRFA